ncbi:MAG: hypothetical protein WCS17_12835, partial [Prevotella sp.]
MKLHLLFVCFSLSLVGAYAQKYYTDPVTGIVYRDSLMFREDFGGNLYSDPSVSTTPIEGCHYNLESVGGYDGEGAYLITKEGFNHSSGCWYTHLDDHTYPNDKQKGYYLSANGSSQIGVFYTTKGINVCLESKIAVSIYGTSLVRSTGYPVSPALLRFEVVDDNDPTTILDSKDVTYQNYLGGDWEQSEVVLDVPSGVSAVRILIETMSPASGGNDFAIDDIEIRMLMPSMDLNINGTPFDYSTLDYNYCMGDPLQIDASVNDNAIYNYAWFYCNSASSNVLDWTKYSDGQTLNFASLKPSDSGYYRVQASKTSISGIIEECYPLSSMIHVNVESCCKFSDTLITHTCLSQYGIYSTDVDQLVQALEGNVSLPDSIWGTTDSIKATLCDTIRSQVTVLDMNPYTKDYLSLKQGTVYSDYGTNFTVQNDTSFVAFVANGGCESIFNVTITVIEPVEDTVVTNVCLSQYDVYGTDQNQLIQALEGYIVVPDSVWGMTETITVGVSDTIRKHVTVVEKNPYTKDYLSLKQGTVYSDYGANFTVQHDTSFVAFVANGGCESVFKVKITVVEDFEETVVTNVCLSEYDVYGTDQNQLVQALEGNIIAPDSVWGNTDTIAAGFTDTIRKHVTVVEKNPYTKDYLSLKQGTVYSDYGVNFTVQHDTSFVAFVANGGCESIFNVTITVIEPVEDTLVTNVCLSQYGVYGTDQNQLIQALEGNIIAPDSVWGMTETITVGVSDTIRNNVTVVEKNPYAKMAVSLKQGTVYSDYGTNFTVQNDTSFIAFVANGGCDSVFNVQLNVLKPFRDTVATHVCLSDYDVYSNDQTLLVKALKGNVVVPSPVIGETDTISG